MSFKLKQKKKIKKRPIEKSMLEVSLKKGRGGKRDGERTINWNKNKIKKYQIRFDLDIF